MRKTIFWTHLVCGVLASLVVLMMSVTGVILTYERQMLDWVNRDLHSEPPAGASRMPIEALVAAVKLEDPEFNATNAVISADPTAPFAVTAGRSGIRYANGYTGEALGEGTAAGLDAFFGAVTGWHRWFNASRENRGPWRAITGASNLVFLFLILSGMYLWLPRIFKWAMFKTRLLFHSNPSSGQARDFNWHHVFGIWTALPLIVVVSTAAVFYYPWANDLVYGIFGEEPPSSTRAAQPANVDRGGTAGSGDSYAAGAHADSRHATRKSLDELFEVAAAHVEGWRSISVQLPDEADETVRFTIDTGNGGQPQRRHTLTVDANTGNISAWQPFQDQSPGRRARSWVRFLHTGEALGIAGQTVAGLVSLTTIIMVWTGLALAYRRLIVPLLERRYR